MWENRARATTRDGALVVVDAETLTDELLPIDPAPAEHPIPIGVLVNDLGKHLVLLGQEPGLRAPVLGDPPVPQALPH